MRKILPFASLCCLPALLVFAALPGCGGPADVGHVSGTVTLDGQPLGGAMVIFTPAEGGLPAAGRTDASGQYTLQYTRDAQGAKIGEHTIRISTYSTGDPDAEPAVPQSPEKVPAKYNVNSDLVETVTAGSNTINFELDSEGEIIEPESEEGESPPDSVS
jgi:YD repeat-containing protein